MSRIIVKAFRAEKDLRWSFSNSEAFFRTSLGPYGWHETVDPFPAYAHDIELVRQEAARVADAFPLDRPVTFCVLDREGRDRTNGYTRIGFDYNAKVKDGEERPWTAGIVLMGKRIPPHPAMTRYLVAHEYGHVVSKYLRWLRGEKDHEEKLYGDYASWRGMRREKFYGGGTWHRSVMEIFANDFRVLIAKSELEFWPHDAPRPEKFGAIRAFWRKEQRKALAANAV